MSVQLGTNPIGWSNDDLPELGGATPLEVCLAEARAAGFAGIELGNKFPRTSGALRPLLERYGLELISGWYSTALRRRSAVDELAAMGPHVDLLLAMGCEVAIVAETTGAVHGQRGVPLSRRPRMTDDGWPEFGERLTELAEGLAARGLRLAYHHHMGTVVETEAEIDRLLAVSGPAVGLLFDTGHLTFAGGDVAACARRHARRVVHVHGKDVRGEVMARAKAQDWSFLDAVVAGVFTPPGGGGVAFVPPLRALREAGYRGWLVVEAEQDPKKAPPLPYARLGAAALTVFALEAGFAVA